MPGISDGNRLGGVIDAVHGAVDRHIALLEVVGLLGVASQVVAVSGACEPADSAGGDVVD